MSSSTHIYELLNYFSNVVCDDIDRAIAILLSVHITLYRYLGKVCFNIYIYI